jgi:hypothetical protein
VKNRRILLLLAIVGTVMAFITSSVIWSRETHSNPGNAFDSDIIFVAEKAYAAGNHNFYYEERVAEIQASGGLTVFVPLILTDTATQVITIPLTSKVISSWGYTHDEALNGNFFGQMVNRFAVSVVPAESGQYYMLGRTFVELIVPDLPADTAIKEVHLVLDLCGSAREMPPALIVANPGVWPGILPDDIELWNSFDEHTVTTLSIENTSCQQPQIRRIAFDPTLFVPGQTIKLVFRDDEDTVDLRPTYSSPTAGRGMLSYPNFNPAHWEFTIARDFPAQ